MINVYRYGSVVYGTTNKNSDKDYIIVTDENSLSDFPIKTNKIFSVNEFNNKLKNHDIDAIECIFLPNNHILQKEIDFNFEIDKQQLRRAISERSSHSWVKGKKKILVEEGLESTYKGIKSIFHSIRILDYGIQLGEKNKIYCYNNVNDVFFDLFDKHDKMSKQELWNYIYTVTNKFLKSKHNEFKKRCIFTKV